MKKLTKIDKIEKNIEDIFIAINKSARENEKRFQSLEKNNKDILFAINALANDNEKRFQRLETRMDGLETRMDGLETRMDGLEIRIGGVETKVGGLINRMVTKDYLDDKLANLRGDLIMLIRKGDAKLCKSIDILIKRKVITKTEAKQVLAMEPFPKTIAS